MADQSPHRVSWYNCAVLQLIDQQLGMIALPRLPSRLSSAGDGCSGSLHSSTGRCGWCRGEPSPSIIARPHANTRLRGDARGSDGGIRQELAAGIKLSPHRNEG